MDVSIDEVKDRVGATLCKFSNVPGAMLPILHDIQDSFGYIPDDALPLIAEHLNLSRAEVYGVVSYYHHFRSRKPGKHVVQVCRAEACQSRGGRALLAHAEKVIACKAGETSANHEFTLEPVYCLGQCACAPSMMVGDEVYGRVDEAKFDQIIAEIKGTI